MKTAVPYVPFKTFLAAVEGLERGIPARFDRSLWPSYSGAIRGQLMAAFRFFELIDDAGCPTPALRELVSGKEQRKAALRAALLRNYEALKELDLPHATPRQLDEAMRQYGLAGVTHRKALAFFIHASTWSGIPLSPLVTGRMRAQRAAAPSRRAADPEPRGPSAGEMRKTIRLKSGGEITLLAHVDLFTLSADDRAFLFELIDRLRSYGGEPGTA